MEYSYHILVLLAGVALAGLTLFGAVAVGPYGRRSVRFTLVLLSCAASVGTALWLVTYLGLIEQRRAIEVRLAELRAQAMSPGSAFACLERAGDAVSAACEQTLFSAAETLAAANFYTAARLDLLTAAARYSGPRTPQFDDAVAALQSSLQQDPFGLTANTLVLKEKCTAERCDAIALFRDKTRIVNNMRQKTYDATVARHAVLWQAKAGAPAADAATPSAPAPSSSGAPIPDRYTLPSASSIPPVSIMEDEPQRPAPAPDRASPPAKSASPQQPKADSPAALSPAAPPKESQKQPARRDKTNAPLSIKPQP